MHGVVRSEDAGIRESRKLQKINALEQKRASRTTYNFTWRYESKFYNCPPRSC